MLFTILTTVTVTIDVLFMLAMAIFMRNLSWSKSENRATIFGFTIMMASWALNIGVLVTLLRAIG